MSMTRAQFLSTLGMGAASLAFPKSLMAITRPVPVYPVNGKRLEGLLGEEFTFTTKENRTATLVLDRFSKQYSTGRNDQFSLEFSISRGATLAEGAYQVEAKTLSPFSMYIVPIGRNEKGQMRYRADFNLLVG
ncbi:MAG: hypothetical protein ABIT01_13685 [Thermoanaerobaculia bacterium]